MAVVRFIDRRQILGIPVEKVAHRAVVLDHMRGRTLLFRQLGQLVVGAVRFVLPTCRGQACATL